MYVTLKLDDNSVGHYQCRLSSLMNGCRIHSVSDGNEEIVTNERYVVMPWKMVTKCGASVTLKEAVEEIKARKEERRLVSEFEAEHRDEILEILGLIDYIDKGYVQERFPEVYKFGCERLGTHFKNQLVNESYKIDFPVKRGYNQLNYFKKLIKAYNGYDSDAVKYVEKVKAFIDKPLDELELQDVRAIRKKVKFPPKLDISVFYQLTGRLPHKELEYDDERIVTHLYDTFMAVSIRLLGKTVRCRINVLYHLLKKIVKEPNADLFPFMKEDSHQ